MKKRLYIGVLTLALCCFAVGCGDKKEKDPKAELRADIVEFVNEELPSIKADRDSAVAIYNNYFTADDVSVEAFAADLRANAIPTMETYIVNLTAVEVSTDEVEGLKNLYLQSAQKQYEAMNKVASAIEEQNTDYLTEADVLINESKSLLTQYESQLKILAFDNDITINGTFTSQTTEPESATSDTQ